MSSYVIDRHHTIIQVPEMGHIDYILDYWQELGLEMLDSTYATVTVYPYVMLFRGGGTRVVCFNNSMITESMLPFEELEKDLMEICLTEANNRNKIQTLRHYQVDENGNSIRFDEYAWNGEEFIPSTGWKTVQDFSSILKRTARQLWDDKITEAEFREKMAEEIQRQYYQAWQTGLRGTGYSESEAGLTQLQNEIEQDVDRLPELANWIAENGKRNGYPLYLSTIIARLNLWINRYQAIREIAKQYESDPQDKYQWIRNPTKDSCPDCLERDGQIRTMAEWIEMGLPKSHDLACGGWNCGCRLQKVQTVKAYEQLPYNIKWTGFLVTPNGEVIETTDNYHLPYIVENYGYYFSEDEKNEIARIGRGGWTWGMVVDNIVLGKGFISIRFTNRACSVRCAEWNDQKAFDAIVQILQEKNYDLTKLDQLEITYNHPGESYGLKYTPGLRYWISPTGEIRRCSYPTHAEEILSDPAWFGFSLPMPQDLIDGLSMGDDRIWATLFARGFVRVMVTNSEYNITSDAIDNAALQKIQTYLQQYSGFNPTDRVWWEGYITDETIYRITVQEVYEAESVDDLRNPVFKSIPISKMAWRGFIVLPDDTIRETRPSEFHVNDIVLNYSEYFSPEEKELIQKEFGEGYDWNYEISQIILGKGFITIRFGTASILCRCTPENDERAIQAVYDILDNPYPDEMADIDLILIHPRSYISYDLALKSNNTKSAYMIDKFGNVHKFDEFILHADYIIRYPDPSVFGLTRLDQKILEGNVCDPETWDKIYDAGCIRIRCGADFFAVEIGDHPSRIGMSRIPELAYAEFSNNPTDPEIIIEHHNVPGGDYLTLEDLFNLEYKQVHLPYKTGYIIDKWKQIHNIDERIHAEYIANYPDPSAFGLTYEEQQDIKKHFYESAAWQKIFDAGCVRIRAGHTYFAIEANELPKDILRLITEIAVNEYGWDQEDIAVTWDDASYKNRFAQLTLNQLYVAHSEEDLLHPEPVKNHLKASRWWIDRENGYHNTGGQMHSEYWYDAKEAEDYQGEFERTGYNDPIRAYISGRGVTFETFEELNPNVLRRLQEFILYMADPAVEEYWLETPAETYTGNIHNLLQAITPFDLFQDKIKEED